MSPFHVEKTCFCWKISTNHVFSTWNGQINVCSYVYRMMEEGKTTFSTLFDDENKHIYFFSLLGCWRKSNSSILKIKMDMDRYLISFRYINDHLSIFPFLSHGCFAIKVLFTDNYTWQNFELQFLRLVNIHYAAIHKT